MANKTIQLNDWATRQRLERLADEHNMTPEAMATFCINYVTLRAATRDKMVMEALLAIGSPDRLRETTGAFIDIVK